MTAFNKEITSHDVVPDSKTNLFRRITNSPTARFILVPFLATMGILGAAHYSGASSRVNNADVPASSSGNRSSEPPTTVNGPEVPASSSGSSEPPLAAITTPDGVIRYRNPSGDINMSEEDKQNGGEVYGQSDNPLVIVKK